MKNIIDSSLSICDSATIRSDIPNVPRWIIPDFRF